MTLYVLVLMVGGWCAIVAGLGLVVHVIRSARKRPARRPVRTTEPGTVVPAGRVYVSSRAAGARRARDRVVASPVKEAGATTTYPSYRSGRHRMAGAVR